MTDNSSILFLLAAVLIIAALLFAVISFTKNGAKRLDVDKFRSKWMAIEQSLNKNEENSYTLSVLNADKLVDQALKDKGVKGETMGERMKNSASLFSNRNAIWTAHKLRNQIAHESDVVVKYDQARSALGACKQALKDIGAI